MFSKKAYGKDATRAMLAIAVCLTVLGVFVVILGGYRFWEKLDLYNIRFKSVKDLSQGRPVKYGGLDVGRILSVGVDPEDQRMIRVVIGLTSRVAIREGVVARIAQKGLVGDYYVFLDPQGTLGEPLPPGSTIPAIETVDLSQLAGIAGEILQELRPRLDSIAASLETVLTSENTARISSVLAKAPGLVEDLQKTSSQIRSDVSNLSKGGKAASDAAAAAFKSVEKNVDDLKVELTRTLAELRAGTAQVSGLTDTMHKAVRYDQDRLEDILVNVERVSEDLRAISSRLRDRPWELVRQPREGKP